MMARFGRVPNQPDRLFNDFLHALKVSDELAAPLRRVITDKARAKGWIEARLGPGTTIPTLAVLATDAEITSFVPPVWPVAAKPTHSSGRLLKIGSAVEWDAARGQMRDWLTHDYFRESFEQNYAGIDKRVIVEPWLDEAFRYEGSVHCRGGVPKVVSIIERYSKRRQSYTTERRALGVSLAYPMQAFELEDWGFFKPLLQAAAQLSAGLSYIRVDFYTDGTRLLFGELTSVPAAGLGRFHPAGGEEVFSAAFFAPPP